MKWLMLFVSCTLFANIGPQGFDDHTENRIFIETGTYRGSGIKKALKAGFDEIRSIEIDRKFCKRAKKKFRKHKNVKVFQGDSSKDLAKVIRDIKEPVTFWLDGHVSPPRTDGGPNCPLVLELDQIKNHPIKTHTILIDDMHCCGTVLFDYLTKDEIIAKIREINLKYNIRYVTGGDEGEYPNNVMVAEVKSGN